MPSIKEHNPKEIIDATGLKCPMPVIKLQQAVRKLAEGEIVSIIFTDPGAEKDIKMWSKINRHHVIENLEEQTQALTSYQIFIKVKSTS